MPGCDAATQPRIPEFGRCPALRASGWCAILIAMVACTPPARRPNGAAQDRPAAVARTAALPEPAVAPGVQSAAIAVPVATPAAPPEAQATTVPPDAPRTATAPEHRPASVTPPPAKSPEKARAGVVPATVAPVKPLAVASTAEPRTVAPTLDLTALEQRLRETHAVGLFTKLSLKNQVDDLLDQFRALYRRQARIPPASLRQQYDLLLLKVLSLLQDGDPPLAAAIASSREAIWNILADPQKFSSI